MATVRELDFYRLPSAAIPMWAVLHVRTLQALQNTVETILAHMQARFQLKANASTASFT